MPLMVSVSGIRGVWGDGLEPIRLTRFASGFGQWVRARAREKGLPARVVLGRDARQTGEVVASLVSATLRAFGCEVIDAGLATTPTVEMAVPRATAAGGIVLSASHNPAQWNALKLLNEEGEFLTPEQGKEVLAYLDKEPAVAPYYALGECKRRDFLAYHIERIVQLPYIHPPRIAARDFKVVVDGVNSVGGIAVPELLRRLGVRPERIICLNCEPTGAFAHNPEPLPEHLTAIMEAVRAEGADIGIAVDPDVDRLALIQEDGSYFGEELTQVLAADFMLSIRSGPVVTNLSSSRALDDIARKYGQVVYRSPVGEVHVVQKMKEVGAVIGGEGNGGVILPDLHYGRDALAGIALVLQHLANTGRTLSEIRATYPTYIMGKFKLPLEDVPADALLQALAGAYPKARVTTIDGVKIDWDDSWVHVRKSNTEPILRIYVEAPTKQRVQKLAAAIMEKIKALSRTS